MRRTDLDLTFSPCMPEDGSALADLRVLAMRESLDRVGRFDPERARARFLSGYIPANTRHLECLGRRVGFVALNREPDHYLLDHLYIHPDDQGRGIGAEVLGQIFSEVDATGLPIRVGALRESDSNRFYLRHGFELIEEAQFDNYYERSGRS